MPAKTKIIDGHEVLFERRRYGGRYGTTYTWAYLKLGQDNYVQLGDPWPCVVPAKSELLAAIKTVIDQATEAAYDKLAQGAV